MTRAIEGQLNEETLCDVIAEVVRRRFTEDALAAIEVYPRSDFSFDDIEVVEVRIIYDEKVGTPNADDMGAVRGDLFGLLARNDDERMPLPRFISRADYFGRSR